MDTHEQFRDSERKTLPIKAAVLGLALLFSAAISVDMTMVIWGGALGAGYAVLFGLTRRFLLPYFQSDAWIYGLLAGDLAFAALAMWLFGVTSPALALLFFAVGYYALFLGYAGAAVSAGMGTALIAVIAAIQGETTLAALGLTFTSLAASAAISGYLAVERFREREGRQRAEATVTEETRARRIIAGLNSVAGAGAQEAWAQSVANELPAVTGFEAVLVFLQEPGHARLSISAHRVPESIDPARLAGFGSPSEIAAVRAMRSGIAEGVQPSEISDWAAEAAYVAGASAPITAGGITMGGVCVYSKKASQPQHVVLEQLERYLGLASQFLLASRRSSALPQTNDRLTRELESAGRTQSSESRPKLELQGITLDPDADRSLVGGVAISLSRTEFDLLYTLATNPGAVVPPNNLLDAAWRGGSHSSGSLDVTIHRLRRKLRKSPEGQGLIKTVRGKGYMLVPPGL